ncbi:MAG: hypothetical protein HUU01_04550 [Saprospiraceae bacterium]|nr:hypothetical protein [Saprospiraceae bacterium]
MEKDIAIIGTGFLSAAGRGLEAFYRQINEGMPEGSVLTDFDPDQYLGNKGLRFVANSTKLYCNVAFQAIEAANLTEAVAQNPDGFGLYDGSELSFVDEVFEFDLTAKVQGPDYVSPMKAPNILGNASASYMAIRAGITGPNFSVSGGAAGSLQAIDMAVLHLQEAQTEYGIVGATDGDCALHDILQRGEKRKTTLKPAPAFGAAFALTTVENARAGGHHIYATIKQVASGQRLGFEENHEVLLRLMEDILKQGGRRKEIDGIVLGGAHTFETSKLIEELWWDFDMDHAKIHLPERLFGICDNNAGSLGLLYAMGLSGNRIEKTSVKSLRSCLIGVVDRLGYASMILVSF